MVLVLILVFLFTMKGLVIFHLLHNDRLVRAPSLGAKDFANSSLKDLLEISVSWEKHNWGKR